MWSWTERQTDTLITILCAPYRSASPLLSATCLVNGQGQFPPNKITPLTAQHKYMLQVITSAAPYGCAKFYAHPYMMGLWANGWNITRIYVFNYLISHLLMSTGAFRHVPHVRPNRGPTKEHFFPFLQHGKRHKYWNNDLGIKETIVCGALASQTVIVSNVPYWWLTHSLAYQVRLNYLTRYCGT